MQFNREAVNDNFIINAPTHDVFEAYTLYSQDFQDDIVEEPIMLDENSRHQIKPIKYPTIWQNYKNQQQVFWVPEEIDFSADTRNWKTLPENIQRPIKHMLGFFAGADSIVAANIEHNVTNVIKIKEASFMFDFQKMMENIHNETYNLNIEAYIDDNDERELLFNSIMTMPAVNAKARWCKDWIESDYTLAHKIFAFAIVEGIFFSSAFAVIFWVKTLPTNPLPGMTVANELISRDERWHVESAAETYALLKNKLKQEVVYRMIQEAIELESEFVKESFVERLPGINADLMVQYAKYCADDLLVLFGYDKLYNVQIGLEYMNMIGLTNRVNFFERRNTDYANANIKNQRVLEDLEDF